MNWSPTDIIQSAALGILFVSMAVTWRKNGRAQKDRDEARAIEEAKRDTTITLELEHITEAINSKDYGLQVLKSEIGKVKTNCASVTAGFGEKISNLEKRRKRK